VLHWRPADPTSVAFRPRREAVTLRALHPLLIGALAVAAALGDVTTPRILQPAFPQPHLVLVFAAVAALTGGTEVALLVAVIAGLAVDTFAFRPMGATAFALLVAVAVLSAISSTTRPHLQLVGVVLVPLVSVGTSVFTAVAAGAGAEVAGHLGRLVDGSVLDAVLVASILAVLLRVRRGARIPVVRA
jgi:rod shape-determining protein MreD